MVQPKRFARTMAANLLSRGAARVPIAWVRPPSGVSLVVPYYHMVSDTYVPHVSPLYRFRTIPEFTADVEFLLKHFEPISLLDIVDVLEGIRTVRRPCFHLTFDDGFTEMYDVVVPILERAGVSATFFLNTAFLDGGGLAHHNGISILLDRLESPRAKLSDAAVRSIESVLLEAQVKGSTLRERLLSLRYGQSTIVYRIAEILDVDIADYIRERQPYLTSEQIRTLLDRGFTIGGHSYDHPLYSDLSLDQQLAQTQKSMDFLRRRFNVSPKAFAFPHNDDGVEEEFFSNVFTERILDVTFGTAGLVGHFHPRNIERVRMEKTSAPAGQILAGQFARATYFRFCSPARDRT
jgi:peptidoglycan/xylan/chitin deacetylase (PgdA/CDA1 family)